MINHKELYFILIISLHPSSLIFVIVIMIFLLHISYSLCLTLFLLVSWGIMIVILAPRHLRLDLRHRYNLSSTSGVKELKSVIRNQSSYACKVLVLLPFLSTSIHEVGFMICNENPPSRLRFRTNLQLELNKNLGLEHHELWIMVPPAHQKRMTCSISSSGRRKCPLGSSLIPSWGDD